MIKSIFHINVNVTDFDRSLAFYKMVGFKVVLELGEGPNPANDVGLNVPNGVIRAALLALSDDPRATRLDLIEWNSQRPKASRIRICTTRAPPGSRSLRETSMSNISD